MIGPSYWTTGINVSYRTDASGQHTWKASLKYTDDGFLSDDLPNRKLSTEGTLETRYYVPEYRADADDLNDIVDVLWEDAQRLGVAVGPNPPMYLYADHEDAYQPHGGAAMPLGEFIQTVQTVAARLGWECSLPDAAYEDQETS